MLARYVYLLSLQGTYINSMHIVLKIYMDPKNPRRSPWADMGVAG